MLSIRGGMGIGDALYVQSVARYLVERGNRLEICTSWPDVFKPLRNSIKFSPFRRAPIDRLAHYTARRGVAGTTQFEDCCITAGIKEKIDLRLDWKPQNNGLLKTVRNSGKPIVVVQMPRAPFGRTDGYGSEFLPDCDRIQTAIDSIGNRAFIVQIGKGVPLFKFSGIDLDLANQTTVSDLIDVGYVADGFLGFCSFIVPLAESFAKSVLLIWSRRGLQSRHLPVRKMTPQKVLHRPSSCAVMDNCSSGELTEAVDAFCEQIRYQTAI